MKYVPNLSEPSYEDKYYIHKSHGGLNECIHIKDGSCLPNCVGYAWGTWYKMLGKRPNLSKGNAENWYAKQDGYFRGSEPKLGAVICFRKGKAGNSSDGAGHVAIVEEINGSTIRVSQSSYGGKRFSTRTLKAPYSYSGLTFQGFIYLPIEFEEEKKTSNDIEYVVKKGDTLSKIAKRYNTTYQELAKYNNIENPNIIEIGQVIKIPASICEDVNKVYHTVKKGESLWSIATKYLGSGYKYKEIKELNNLKSDTIKPGQVLRVK